MEEFENAFEEMVRMMSGGLTRPVLTTFQSVTLPAEVFQNQPELLRELENKSGAMVSLGHARVMAMIRCVQAGGMPSPHTITEEDVQAQNELFRTLSVQAHRANGYTAHVVTMPAPQSPPEAYYAAIVFKDDEPKVYQQPSPSTRYFTLEKSLGDMRFFCEYRPDGSRRNLGELAVLDQNAFVRTVFERIARAARSGTQ